MSAEAQPEGAPSPEQVREQRRERSLRRALWMAGTAMLVGALLPWNVHRDWIPPWEVATRLDTPLLLAVGLCGVGMWIARMRFVGHRRRAFAAAALGAVAAGSLFFFTVSPGVVEALPRDLQRMSTAGLHGLMGAMFLSTVFEVAYHQAPRSRLLPALSAIAWLLPFAIAWIPFEGGRFDLESAVVGGLFFAFERGKPEVLLVLTPFWIWWWLSLLGLVMALRRLGPDRGKAAAKRFQTSWIAYTLITLPTLVVGLPLAAFAVVEEPRIATHILLFALLPFGVFLGFAAGVGHGLGEASRALDELRERRAAGDATAARRLRLVGRVALAAILLFVVGRVGGRLLPGPDGQHGRLAVAVADAIVGAEAGEPVPSDLLGGYSSLDLRSARGAFAGVLPGEGPVTWELFAMRFDVHSSGGGFSTWMVVTPSGEVTWGPTGDVTYGSDGALVPGSAEALGDALSAALEGRCSATGLPRPPADLLASLPPPAPFLGEGVAGGLASCIDGGPELPRLRDTARETSADGRTDRYLLWVRRGDARAAVSGAFFSRADGLWVGPPEPFTSL